MHQTIRPTLFEWENRDWNFQTVFSNGFLDYNPLWFIINLCPDLLWIIVSYYTKSVSIVLKKIDVKISKISQWESLAQFSTFRNIYIFWIFYVIQNTFDAAVLLSMQWYRNIDLEKIISNSKMPDYVNFLFCYKSLQCYW